MPPLQRATGSIVTQPSVGRVDVTPTPTARDQRYLQLIHGELSSIRQCLSIMANVVSAGTTRAKVKGSIEALLNSPLDDDEKGQCRTHDHVEGEGDERLNTCTTDRALSTTGRARK